MNYAVGNKASLHSGKRVFSEADGIIESHELHITPRSLYLQQLQDRLGEQAVLNITTEAQRAGPIWDQLKTDE